MLSDEHASSHHALFQPAHGYWFVQDLGSTNGTWLNGRRMFAAQRLKKGDKIKIGRTIVVVVSPPPERGPVNAEVALRAPWPLQGCGPHL